ncbi:Uncharacterised protein [Tatumella ptyseos]|uniref:Uncharacterized protein n=1 Tax=Tatumella ptyseos TaxID=82987 RepID=A0A2X5NQA5_9GAMM|nr:Uncharacterised protein [Tatumella ptyseos]
MSLCVIGEQKISSFSFKVDEDIFSATISSILAEGDGGKEEYHYSVIVTDRSGNLVMKEIHQDFQVAYDVFDRLSILVGSKISHS